MCSDQSPTLFTFESPPLPPLLAFAIEADAAPPAEAADDEEEDDEDEDVATLEESFSPPLCFEEDSPHFPLWSLEMGDRSLTLSPSLFRRPLEP
jgi:hypothetical protein